ncbi:response regulator [Microbacterium jiangjiandongii]|uniref:response regulator n=1 Tax=Microbacterium jiangjiandongii TaxID=3049071 RepID=UPI0035B5FE6D
MTDAFSLIRVAVVDDQPLIREGFARAIRAQPDMELVATGSDGEEAIALAARSHPDVILMDVRMPRLGGIAATRAIAGPLAGDGAPRVLVVTTFSLDEYVFEALRAGASGFLLKDTPPQDLLAGIRTVARGEALLAPAVTRRLIGAFAGRVRPDAEATDFIATLTPRELDVLKALAQGMSNAEIAGALVVTRETVKTYVTRVLAKLQVRDRVQAVVLAYRSGLVDD